MQFPRAPAFTRKRERSSHRTSAGRACRRYPVSSLTLRFVRESPRHRMRVRSIALRRERIASRPAIAWPRKLGCALAALGVAGVAAPSASAQAQEIALTAVPEQVTLDTAGEATVQVLATNSADAAQKVRLGSSFDTPNAPVVELLPGPSRPIPAGETRVWTLELSSGSDLIGAAKLYILARSANGAVSSAQIAVNPTPPLDLTKTAQLELQTALATLRSGEAGTAYLLLRNPSARPFEVGEIHAFGPDFVSFGGLDNHPVVEPGRLAVIPISVDADEEVDPGKHQLVFTVTVRAGLQTSDLSATNAVDIGVTGESELLTALGVPSLLLVPGFLLVGTFILLWKLRIGRPSWDTAAAAFDAKSGEFWVMAVGFSMLIVLLADWFGADLFGRYGLNDLIALWAVSAGVAALAYGAYVAYRRSRRRKLVPKSTDDPIEILRKLGRQNLGLHVPRYQYAVDNQKRTLYLVQPRDDLRTADWLTPPIEYTWKGSASEGAEELERQIKENLLAGEDPAGLAALLEAGQRSEDLTVGWAPAARPVDGPREIERSKRGSEQGLGRLVGEEVGGA